jgi:autotransporter adhesin
VNRIYRLVWNAREGNWIVASETAAARGKRSGSRQVSGAAVAAKIAVAGAVVMQVMFASTLAFAYANDGSTATGTGAVAVGGGAGYAATAGSKNSVAIGSGATANSRKSGAATDTGAVAIGTNSTATTTTGGGPVAIGTSASAVVTGTAGASPVAIGTTANANGTGSQVAIGDRALATGQDAIAIGGHANSAGVQATGAESTAIGQSSVATNTGSVALGYMSSSTGVGSVALGGNGVDGALAGGANAFAVGAGANAVADNTIALGGGASANAVNGIAMGASASATGNSSVAIGANSMASGSGGMALGPGAYASNANDVALGSNSTTTTPSTGPYSVNGGNIAGTSNTNGVVSVGAPGAERQIQNVSAGQVSASSTDAVNGSQLYAAGEAINSLSDSAVKYDTNSEGAVNYNSITLNPGGSPTTITNVAPGTVSSTSTDAVNGAQLYETNQNVEQNTTAISSIQNGQAGPFVSDNSQTATQPVSSGANAAAGGFGASATGDHSLVVGNDAADNGNANATVLGEGASVASNVAGSNVALGQGSAVTTAAVPVAGTTINGTEYSFAGANPVGVVSVGSAGQTRQITNVAAGQISGTSTDAVNGSQLYATNQALSALDTAVNSLGSTVSQALSAGTGDTSTGGGAGVGTDGSGSGGASGTPGSPGYVINDQTYNNGATGTHYYSANDGGTQGGNYSSDGATGRNSVAVGVNTVSSGTSSTAVGNGAVASGTNSVALGANSVASAPNTVSVGAPGSERTVSNVAPGVNGTDAVNVNQLGAVAMQSTQQFDSLQQGMSSLRHDMYGATAAAMAVAGLPQPTAPGKSMLSVAGSTFHGQQGMAVGLSTVTENGKWVIKGAMAANTRNDVGAVVSAGYQW